MAIYLGSSRAKAIRGSVVEVESPYTRQIIEGTISGVYSNSRISKIEEGAFYSCSSLTSADFPNCTSIGAYAFYSCRDLTSISFPNCTSIGANAFAGCSSLTKINFSNCTFVGGYAFAYCSNLNSIIMPLCITLSNEAFYRCSALTSIELSLCTTLSKDAFQGCITLAMASFPSCSYIGSSVFHSCYHLLSLYLLGSSIPTLFSINAFNSTPISNDTTSTNGVYGSIYVPSSLYNNYIVATNWSIYSARFVSV